MTFDQTALITNLFQGARLSAAGLGMMILPLVTFRIWLRVCGKPLPPPMRTLSAPWDDAFTLIVALIPVAAFIGPIVHDYIAWLNVGKVPMLALIAIWLLVSAEMFLLYRLAVSSQEAARRKIIAAMSWVVLAHLVGFVGQST